MDYRFGYTEHYYQTPELVAAPHNGLSAQRSVANPHRTAVAALPFSRCVRPLGDGGAGGHGRAAPALMRAALSGVRSPCRRADKPQRPRVTLDFVHFDIKRSALP